MQSPKINFRKVTQDTLTLYAERNKDVRIQELLEANNALVEANRAIKRRFRLRAMDFFVAGMALGCGLTVVAVALVGLMLRFWLFK